MTWWLWTLLWLLLLLAAAAFLFVMGRRLVRQGLALARELGEAADRLAQVGDALESLADRTGPPAPAPGHGEPSAAGHRSSTRGTGERHRRPPRSQDVR